MQFYSSLLVFWTFLLLALRAGVTALPIPSVPVSVPVRIETRDSEMVTRRVVVEPRAPVQSPSQPRRSRVRRAPGSRSNRPLKRARDVTGSSVKREGFSPMAKRAQSGDQVKQVKRAEEDDDTPPDNNDTPTDDAPTNGSPSGVSCANLFPVNPYIEEMSWTTCPGAAGARPLTMDVFGKIQHVSNKLKHEIDVAPDGSPALVAHYAKGSYALQTKDGRAPGGISFYAPGPDDVDLTKASEATFGYSIFFPKDFKFALGGKLLGFYGGDSEDEAFRCGGGIRTDKCFSTRLMWREKGNGELYPYLPSKGEFLAKNADACEEAESSLGQKPACHTKWGMSIGTGSFIFKRGAWTTVSQRVKLNDVGEQNGEIEVFAEGESVILLKGITLRTNDEARIHGLMMQSFFGGSSTPEYASPEDQVVFFKDFSVAVTKLL